jgi:hypothetical protein
MLTRKRRLAIGGATLATSLVVGITAATAATPFTVHAGTAKPGTKVAFTGKSKGAITLTDTTTSFSSTCTSATSPGSTKTGKHPGAAIARVSGPNTKFKGCSALGGLVTLTTKGVGAWLINAKTFKNGVVHGSLSKVNANVTASNGCTFTVKGQVPLTYGNKKHILSLLNTKSNLSISNAASSCAPFINSGDKASLQAKFVIKANKKKFNPITIRR